MAASAPPKVAFSCIISRAISRKDTCLCRRSPTCTHGCRVVGDGWWSGQEGGGAGVVVRFDAGTAHGHLVVFGIEAEFAPRLQQLRRLRLPPLLSRLVAAAGVVTAGCAAATCCGDERREGEGPRPPPFIQGPAAAAAASAGPVMAARGHPEPPEHSCPLS